MHNGIDISPIKNRTPNAWVNSEHAMSTNGKLNLAIHLYAYLSAGESTNAC